MSTFEIKKQAARNSGVHDAKRRATHRRIIEAGIRLFLERGYDATRLEDIAEAAEISRRTFFAYFRSKDEILRTWERDSWEEILGDVRGASPDESPLQVIRNAVSKRLSRHNTEKLRAIAYVISSSETLRAAKHFSFAEREKLLFEVLCEVWRQPERKLTLRLVAMSAVGALRVAVEKWELPSNRRPLHRLFVETLDALKSAIS